MLHMGRFKSCLKNDSPVIKYVTIFFFITLLTDIQSLFLLMMFPQLWEVFLYTQAQTKSNHIPWLMFIVLRHSCLPSSC